MGKKGDVIDQVKNEVGKEIISYRPRKKLRKFDIDFINSHLSTMQRMSKAEDHVNLSGMVGQTAKICIGSFAPHSNIFPVNKYIRHIVLKNIFLAFFI